MFDSFGEIARRMNPIKQPRPANPFEIRRAVFLFSLFMPLFYNFSETSLPLRGEGAEHDEADEVERLTIIYYTGGQPFHSSGEQRENR